MRPSPTQHARISPATVNAAICFLAALLSAPLPPSDLLAQEASAESPPAGARDELLQALPPSQRDLATAVLEASPCLCGCRLDLAGCRVQHPECSRSTQIGEGVAQRAAEGQSQEKLKAFVRSQPVLARPRPASADRRSGRDENSALEPEEHTFSLDGAASHGPEDAPVTIVEFSDFQCGFCARSQKPLKELLALYPDQVRLVYKHFPLPSHKHARVAALAAMAAQAQGKFWPMHDLLFANRPQLDRPTLLRLASELKLDLERFERDLHSTAHAARVEEDLAEGRAARLPGTPSFYVNGQKVRYHTLQGFEQAVTEALLEVKRAEALAGWCPVPSR